MKHKIILIQAKVEQVKRNPMTNNWDVYYSIPPVINGCSHFPFQPALKPGDMFDIFAEIDSVNPILA
jgi:hypothetical protein